MSMWIVLGTFIGTILTIIFLSVGEMKLNPTLLDALGFIAFTFGVPIVSAYLAFRVSRGQTQ